MKNIRLILLAIVTLIVIIAASVAVNLRAPKTVIDKGILFPGLASHINDMTTLRIKGYGETVTLRKKGDGWVIEEIDDYPALFDRVKQTIIGISELKVVSTKTSNPDLYSRLGVEGPGVADSPSVLVTLENNEGKEAAALIVGKQRRSKSAEKSPGLYVRRPQDKYTLLVEGAVDITARISSWFERTLFDIPSSSIKEIVTRHADGDIVRLSRNDRAQEDFTLEDIPEGKKVAIKIVLNRMATILENFHVSRARGAGNFAFPEYAHVTTLRTFDGMGITVKSAQIDDVAYVKVKFDYDPEMATVASTTADAGGGSGGTDTSSTAVDFAAHVSMLNEKLSDWVYTIPEFKYEILEKRMADLVKPDINSPSAIGTDEMDVPPLEIPTRQ
jgi:hypothetical protein